MENEWSLFLWRLYKCYCFVGGTLLTISGSGFATDAVVQVGGVDCTVQDSQPGQVTCLTPHSVSFT